MRKVSLDYAADREVRWMRQILGELHGQNLNRNPKTSGFRFRCFGFGGIRVRGIRVTASSGTVLNHENTPSSFLK